MAHQDVKSDVDTLVDELAKLRSDLTDWTNRVAKISKGGAEKTLSNLRSRAREYWQSDLQDVLDGARESSRKAARTVQHRIQERPIASTLALTGIVVAGFLLARLLSRR
jgi:ElaB/YqjD/DUF883 family membrane-anchored ribosome-binding protein